MHIGFDGKRAAQNLTGLGNYSRYVLEGLAQANEDLQLTIYAPKLPSHARLMAFAKHPAFRWILPTGGWKWIRSLWRVAGLTHQLESDGVEVFHGLSNELPLSIHQASGVRTVVTIHDLIFLRFPSCYGWIDRHIYNYKFRKACEHADRIVAVSECTKRDIIQFYHISPDKIDVVYQGCDAAFARPLPADTIQAIKRKYQLPHRYLLNVGSIEERKNVLLAVQALTLLPEQTVLVIVGKHTPYTDKVWAYAQAHGLQQRVRILHGVPFSDLVALVQGARVFTYPSRFEGFGIPVLEALSAGVPVVAATGSCLEEAGGPSSIYVHPDDYQALARAVASLWEDSAERSQRIATGLAFAQTFNPQQQTQQLLRIYRSLNR